MLENNKFKTNKKINFFKILLKYKNKNKHVHTNYMNNFCCLVNTSQLTKLCNVSTDQRSVSCHLECKESMDPHWI